MAEIRVFLWLRGSERSVFDWSSVYSRGGRAADGTRPSSSFIAISGLPLERTNERSFVLQISSGLAGLAGAHSRQPRLSEERDFFGAHSFFPKVSPPPPTRRGNEATDLALERKSEYFPPSFLPSFLPSLFSRDFDSDFSRKEYVKSGEGKLPARPTDRPTAVVAPSSARASSHLLK